jgi:hypothetical protein
MNKIKKFFYFIYRKAIGDDIETIKYMVDQHNKGEPILDPEKKKLAIQALKEVPKELFTKSWYWILAIIFVFCMGYLVGGKVCEVECHNFIVDNYENPTQFLTKVSPSIPVFPGNISHEAGEYENEDQYTIPQPIG